MRNNVDVRFQHLELPKTDMSKEFAKECERKHGPEEFKRGKEDLYDRTAINGESLLNSVANGNELILIDDLLKLPKIKKECLNPPAHVKKHSEEPFKIFQVDHPGNLMLHGKINDELMTNTLQNFAPHPKKQIPRSRVTLEGFPE